MLKRSTILNKESVDTLAIGSFDGIHLGHRQLIRRLGAQGALFVIDKDQANLTPGIKRSVYAGYPCMFYHFLKVKQLSGEEFVALLRKEFPCLKKIVVGYDFCFGNNRSCCAQDLTTLFDGEVDIVEPFRYHNEAIHSSQIRSYLQAGKLEEANRFLGREYSIEGDVISGQGIGKEHLVPTLNLKVLDYLIPKAGVYACRARIGEHFYDAVCFIGNRLLTDGRFAIETHIMDTFLQEAPAFVELFFVKYVRDIASFHSFEALKQQIERDCEDAHKALPTCRVYWLDFLE